MFKYSKYNYNIDSNDGNRRDKTVVYTRCI